MNIIINVSTKTIEILDSITIDSLKEFVDEHNLNDYSIVSRFIPYTSTPYYPPYTEIPAVLYPT